MLYGAVLLSMSRHDNTSASYWWTVDPPLMTDDEVLLHAGRKFEFVGRLALLLNGSEPQENNGDQKSSSFYFFIFILIVGI